MANNLMDQKLKSYAMKNAENKRKFENSQKDNCGQQPPFKRQNVGGQNVVRAYTAGNNERKVYNGPLPLCNKCKFHHEGPCTVRCGKYNKCGRKGQYKSDCPKLKDHNCRNKTGTKSGIGEAKGKAYVLGGGDANPDSNVVTDVSYAVKLADGRVSETNTVLRGCTLRLLVIVCDEKLVLIPYGDEVLIVQGDRSGKVKKSKKETKDKSEEKRLEDVPTVRVFPKVFPEELPGLPQTRQNSKSNWS
ncbi:hypothetical protein Tco_1414802 [Tanacetum coccineum]